MSSIPGFTEAVHAAHWRTGTSLPRLLAVSSGDRALFCCYRPYFFHRNGSAFTSIGSVVTTIL